MPKRKTEAVDYLDTPTKRSRISIAHLTEKSPYTKTNSADGERRDAAQKTQSAAQDDQTGDQDSRVYVLVYKSSAKHWDEPEVAIEGVFKTEAAAEKAFRKSCASHCDVEPYDPPSISPGIPRHTPGKPDRVWECSFQHEELSYTQIWVEEHIFGDAAINAEKRDSEGDEASS
ncbi:uncharacterized protein MYCFIDRAFT_81177 [Pseudocercospora fijiensis CIRAD86]|uniref:Uncharacterized protein n=1 Tax=Pseudocercospora fijiensis (strain CIRAD86) TaxID=383855 RepID=M2ZKV6_PSEFD|nr:uncharacterized protein MYCFIDRAFT_81177 [Pseudocercospora fijiensis CIRAD86]EME79694.1 hypothetical protein MYCFIDRAFT_81177 [Pseudocercospora fijiensis CIRAD86]